MSNCNESRKIGVIWTRVSSKKQKDNGGSLEHQIETCRQYAKQHNIEVIKEFGGTNESAKVQGKLFKAMVAEVKRTRRIECLIVYSLDRFGRNTAESTKTADELNAAGVSVLSTKQEVDTRTPQGKFMRNLNFALAELDNDIRRDKCVEGVKAKIKAGLWCGRTPIGYYSQGRGRNTKFFVNSDGELLRVAFRKKLQGERNIDIMQWLANRGLNINKQKLHKILVNPFYAGKISHKTLGGAIIDGNQPPLITWSEFECVQDILSGRTGRYVHDKESPRFPLLNHVFCADDHRVFTKYTTKGCDYYKCNVKGCRNNRSAKDMHRKYAELLDKFTIPSMLMPIFEKVVADYLAYSSSEDAKTKTLLTKNLTETTNKIKKAQINFATGAITDDIYKTAMTELTSQKLKIEAELEQCNAKLSNSRNRIHAIAQMCCKLGDLWRGGTLNVCQKVQHLAFPNGVEWDKSILNYRTFTANGMLDVINKLTDSYREKEEDKPTKKSICPLVCG